MKKLNLFLIACATLLFAACSSDDDNPTPKPTPSTENGVFIVNEGNYGYGNASLSYYNGTEKTVQNEIYANANNASLGDVAQSMTLSFDGKTAYVVVNNSGVIKCIDTETFASKGNITGFTSPRYIHSISATKAYVTDMYAKKVTIINPSTYSVTGSISTGTHQGTEQMVAYGDYVFTNCWSYDNKILVLNTKTDAVVDSITVGVQPAAMVIDKNNKIWVMCDGGGWAANPFGYEAPALYRIDAATRAVEGKITFALGDYVSKMCISPVAETGSQYIAYLYNGDVYSMNIKSSTATKIISSNGNNFYGIACNPSTAELYLADAVDYVQAGKVYRYNGTTPIDTISVGVCPSGFCFK